MINEKHKCIIILKLSKMKTNKQISAYLLFNFFLFFLICNLSGQDLPGQYTTTWAGNTFGNGTKWVQDYMFGSTVSPDGKVFTNSHWDEAGKTAGIYQDGDAVGRLEGNGFAVASNHTHVYIANGTRVVENSFEAAKTGKVFWLGSAAGFLAANDQYLVSVHVQNNKVKLFDISTEELADSFTVQKPGAVAIDENNHIWIVSGIELPDDNYERKFFITNDENPPVIMKYDKEGNKLQTEISGFANWIPTCLSISNTGELMVGDDGPKHQVHFYDMTAKDPVLLKSLGTEGGISSGVPGEWKPLKLWGIKGTGTDSEGNIYVIMTEDGSTIRSFTPEETLNWEVNCAHFVDCMDFDPYSDGKILYGKNEIINMDYTKESPGTEWKMSAYTQDRVSYPDDPRNFYTGHGHEFTTAFLRRVNGMRIMFLAGMYGPSPYVYAFNEKMAHLAYTHKFEGEWGFWPDAEGTIWNIKEDAVYRTPLLLVTKNDELVYGATEKVGNIPAPFNEVRRLYYYPDDDLMYMIGYTPDKPYDGNLWKEAGRVLARYPDWSTGNREADLTMDTPWEADGFATMSMAVAGDYLFLSGTKSRAEVRVYSRNDFSFVGTMMPGNPAGGISNTGWIDIPYGNSAFKRSNGEYIILVEDDYKSRQIVYRWCPDGDCAQGIPYIGITFPDKKITVHPDSSLNIEVHTYDDDGTIDLVQFYANDTLIGENSAAPFSLSWKPGKTGSFILTAKATDNSGLSFTSGEMYVRAGIPDTVAPSVPSGLNELFAGITSVSFNWRSSSDNDEVAGYKIFQDGDFSTYVNHPDTMITIELLEKGTQYSFQVCAFDMEANESQKSNTLKISTTDIGEITSPWDHADIGEPALEGTAGYLDGTFNILASGADVWGTSDQFHYIYQSWNEGVEITAKVSSIDNTDGWAKAGIMIRNGLENNASHAFTAATVASGIAFQRRPVAAGESDHTGGASVETPYWVKMNKIGPLFKAYQSADGINWSLIGQDIIEMKENFYIGLAATSHNNSALTLAVIDSLAIQTIADTIPPDPPGNLSVDNITENSLTLSWNSASDDYGIIGYEVYQDGVLLGSTSETSMSIEDLQENTSYKFYVVSIDAGENNSENSSEIDVTTLEATGISNRLNKNIQVYPNPGKDGFLYIKMNSQSVQNSLKVSIHSLDGRLMQKEIFNTSSNRMYTLRLNKKIDYGVYILSVDDGTCVMQEKIVIWQ